MKDMKSDQGTLLPPISSFRRIVSHDHGHGFKSFSRHISLFSSLLAFL